MPHSPKISAEIRPQLHHRGAPGPVAEMHDGATTFDRLVAGALDKSDDVIVILEYGSNNSVLIAGMNDAFCRMSGYSDWEATGKPFLMLADGASDPAVRKRVVEAVASATSLRTELLCKRRDGTAFWFGFHIMPAADSTEFGAYSVALGRDITATLRVGEEQRATQELLASVFAAVDAGVAIISDDGRFLMVNPKVGPMFGYPPNSLDGKPTIDLIAANSRDIATRSRQQQLADGKPYSINIHARRNDGSEFPARLTSVIGAGSHRRFRVVTITPSLDPELPARIQVAGKLQLIGLTEVKAALGARWDKMVDRVMQTADHVLRRRLGPQDKYSRTDDHGFLVCFAELSEQEASFRAAMIAREIRNKLIGEGEEPAAAQVTAIATSLPLAAGAAMSPSTLTRMIEERLKVNLGDIHAKARQTLQAAIREVQAIPDPIIGGNGSEIVAAYAVLPEQTEDRIHAALSALARKESEDFDLDALRLSLAAECCARISLQGAVGPVFVSIGFEVFDTRAKTDRYVAVLSKLDPKLQKRLTLMFAQLPVGVPRSRLQDCMQRVRPYCGGIGFEIEKLRLQPSLPNETVLAIDASSWVELPDSQLMRFVTTVHANNNRLLVRRVATRDAAMALRTLGVDLISMRP